MRLSIEISENSAYACVGKSVKGKVQVFSAGEITLQNGVVSGGMVKDKLSFLQAVNGYIGMLRTRPQKAVVSVSSKLSLFKEITLPIAPEAEFALMVKSEMLQQINDNIRYKVDYSYRGRTGNMVRVMAYAIPEEMISELKSILKELHLKPVKLDVSSNCVNRLFSYSVINGLPIDNDPVIIADVGLSTLVCNLFTEGHMVIFRTAPVSILDLERVLAYLGRNDASEENFSNLDFSPQNLENDILLYDASKRYLGTIVEELLKVINYQVSKKASDPVRRVYLYGQASMVKGLPEYLSSTLNIPVDRIEITDKIKMPAGFQLASAVNCIGTILDR